jgi:secondary thiamine-phosphate synthase enzyme
MRTLTISTEKSFLLKDITPLVQKEIDNRTISEGMVHIFVRHTTAGIRIIESENGLLTDINQFLDHIAPKNKHYAHDNILERGCSLDEPLNGHAHLQSLLINSSEAIPISKKRLMLGKWQRIFLVELDGPRQREIIIQVYKI